MRRQLTVFVLGVFTALAVCSTGMAGAARDTRASEGGSNPPIKLWIGDAWAKGEIRGSWSGRWTGPGSTWIGFTIRGEHQVGTMITIQCKLDAAAWRKCWTSDPVRTTIHAEKRFDGIKPGWHTIRVRAVDAAGSVVPTTPLSGYQDVYKWWVGSIANPGPPPIESLPDLNLRVDSRGSFEVTKSPWSLSVCHPCAGSPMRLKAGVYDIWPDDRTSAHNIHLVGVGVDRRTSVAGTTMTGNHQTVWWRSVRLRPGKLTVYSDRAPTKRISITVVS